MRVRIDTDRCQGHTVCNMIAPDVFDLDDDDGHAVIVTAIAGSDVPADLIESVNRAARNCPELAILVED